jgi:arsenate reductase
MTNLTFYGYPKCDTCRKAKYWLEAAGQPLQYIDVVQNPPSEDELERIVTASGYDISKFFNTSGEAYRALGLKDMLPSLSRADKLKLLASNGKLIKRPIVVSGDRVTVGFREEEFLQMWGNG